ncbi:MAG: ABC transporter permease [Myxococcota bacterium]|nr:ABC transporter permease [Myxococcota bacterium]
MTFARGLYAQLQVIHAILLREVMTRFGAYQLGYLWALIEPLLWLLTFAVMFFLVNRQIPDGMDLIGFLTTGIFPYMIFRQTVDRSMTAIAANKALLFYPQIRPLDLVIARCTLEIATLVTVFVLILAFNSLFNVPLVIDNLLLVMAGLAMAGMLGAVLGLTISALSVYSNIVERIIGPLLRPLFWISGLFFTANELPTAVRKIFLWNPVLHTVELTRDGVFTQYDSREVDIGYLAMCILVFAFLGLALERMARRRLDVT